MMVTDDGYSISEDFKRNQLIITLPQTPKTLTSTALPVCERKEKLSEDDKMIILSIIKELYSN